MLFDNALVPAATAAGNLITHMQLHSADPGTGTTAPLGTRVAVAKTIDADGDIIFTTPVTFTGLAANQPVAWVSYWGSAGTGTPATGGTCYGKAQIPTGGTNDLAANAAGTYVLNSAAEAFTSA